MNWYAYKVLADTYAADRQAEAARHRQARESRRPTRSRDDAGSTRIGSWAAAAGRRASNMARLRRRTPAVAARPTIAGPPSELRPSLPR